MSNNKQKSVQWSNHPNYFGSIFPQMLSGRRFVDVILACEGRRIHCHRVVLAACSRYFSDLLDETPAQYSVIILPKDVKFWMIQALVDFMYSGEVSVHEENFEELVKCAELLEIQGFKRVPTVESQQEPEKESEDQEIVTEFKVEDVDALEILNEASEPLWFPNEGVQEKNTTQEVIPPVELQLAVRNNFNPTWPGPSYTREDLWAALRCVQNGMSMRRAAIIHRIPNMTFHRFVKRNHVKSFFNSTRVNTKQISKKSHNRN
ncbi:hypothetical protein DMENIID0001_135940 [Sergentomyia squamirostris]